MCLHGEYEKKPERKEEFNTFLFDKSVRSKHFKVK